RHEYHAYPSLILRRQLLHRRRDVVHVHGAHVGTVRVAEVQERRRAARLLYEVERTALRVVECENDLAARRNVPDPAQGADLGLARLAGRGCAQCRDGKHQHRCSKNSHRTAPAPTARRSASNARTASTNGAASNRTGSVVGNPVSSVTRSISARASRSLMSTVFSEIPIVFAGRSGCAIASCNAITSPSGGIGSHALWRNVFRVG